MADPDECRPGPADARDDPCDEIVRRDERQRLYEAIADLPVRQAAVLIALIEHDAEGYAEISRRLGLPIGSLGPTRRRALQRLRTDPRLASGSRTSQRPEPAAATRSSA